MSGQADHVDHHADDTEILTVNLPDGKRKPKQRTFTVAGVTYDGEDRTETFSGGKYAADSPAGAAKKAATKAFRELLRDNPDASRTLDIVMRETTSTRHAASDDGPKRRVKTGEEYPYRATKDALGDKKRPVVFLKGLWELTEDDPTTHDQWVAKRDYKEGDLMVYTPPKKDETAHVYRCLKDHKSQDISFGADIRLESLRVKGGKKRPVVVLEHDIEDASAAGPATA